MKRTTSIKYWKRASLWFLPIIILLVVLPFVFKDFESEDGSLEFGYTFSTKYAEELGLDWAAVYIAALNDFSPKYIRIPAYWDRVEPINNIYDWSELDFMLDEALNNDTKVLLAIGRRLPRWPECHDPHWLPGVADEVFERELFEYVETAVLRYRDHPAVVAWQVENEPFLAVFGECPPLDQVLLQQEIALVRDLDERDIVVTESGELSSWFDGGALADVVGVSMYKVTWNAILGYFYYPIPPAFYYYKTKAIEKYAPARTVISTELQVEPWTPEPIATTPLREQFRSMDLDQVKSNIAFARKTGFSQVLIWGIEWWYWLKVEHNNATFWEYGKTIFN